MKNYLIHTTDMTDRIHLELMQYTKGCVGEFSRLGNIYVLSTDKKSAKQIEKLPFVTRVDQVSEAINIIKKL